MEKAVVFLADGLEEIEGLIVVDAAQSRRAGDDGFYQEKEQMVTGHTTL